MLTPAGAGNDASVPKAQRNVMFAWYLRLKSILIRAKLVLKSEGLRALIRAGLRKIAGRLGIARIRPKSSMGKQDFPHPLGIQSIGAVEVEAKIHHADLWAEIYSQKELRKGAAKITSSGGKTIAYFTNQLLDWNDQRPRFGGGERYCLMLTNLLTDLGFVVDLYQLAPRKFEGDYYGYRVRSIEHGSFFSEFNLGAANAFYEISRDYDHVIYNLPELSSAKMRLDAISICHGIWFDHNNYASIYQTRSNEWFRHLYRAFDNPRKIVSVDTNSINVIRSLWPELAAKITFIPNFVDHRLFSPPRERRNNTKPVILFPRRSQINRGSRILADVLRNVPHDVDFFWVGEGDDYDTRLVQDLCKKDIRLHYQSSSFEEMPDWYRKADIVVIPTIACEGTSLSCIEALASGCATIATSVGGLTDLVQDEVNGRSVAPKAKDIAEAINELIEDTGKRKHYQQEGYESSLRFSIDEWRKKWMAVLKDEGWMTEEQDVNPGTLKLKKNRVVIVTRNAIHGGVESLVKLESKQLPADVIVAGGLNDPLGTCPFTYRYVSSYPELMASLAGYDVVVYHWPLDWAVKAIRDSGLPSIEFVHRTDTSDCDKTAPTRIVTHSQYVIRYIGEKYQRKSEYVPNVVDINRFFPDKSREKKVIGSITSYYDTKGVDIILRAWAKIQSKYPDYTLRFYGSGTELEKYQQLADKNNIRVELLGPTTEAPEVIREFCLFVSASKIEGLPITMLEALASNIPVLASDIEGHKAINDIMKQNGYPESISLFRSGDVNDLARKMDRFLSAEKRDEMNSREAVAALFNGELHISKLCEVIESISTTTSREKRRLEIVDQSANNGVFSMGLADEGFHWIIEADKEVDDPKISYEKYIGYRYIITKNVTDIACTITCSEVVKGDVLLQCNWCDKNGSVLKMDVVGNHTDSRNTMYFFSSVPVDTSKNVYMVDVIIRPSSGIAIEINHLEITAYRLT